MKPDLDEIVATSDGRLHILELPDGSPVIATFASWDEWRAHAAANAVTTRQIVAGTVSLDKVLNPDGRIERHRT